MPSQNACSSPIFRQVSRPQYGFWGRFSGNFRQGIDRFKIWSPIADPQQDVGTPPLFSSEQLFLARQPILDDRQQVFAYELLCRELRPAATTVDESARTLDAAVLSIGLDELTAGRLAFLKVSRRILLRDAATLLPPEGVVLEVPASVGIDDEVLAACKAMRNRGYTLAAGEFTLEGPAAALLPLVEFVKVRATDTTPEQLAAVASHVRARGTRPIAEGVEILDAYERARASGFLLFQGYFFCRPRTFAVRTISTRPLAQVALVAALNKPNVTLGAVEELLKRDPNLSLRVLRSVNSAGAGLRREVHSIREALLLLGLHQVRKWASVWALAGANGGSPELVSTTVLRARCCELLGAQLDMPDGGSEYFLLGLCSLLDVVVGCTMEQAVKELPLTPTTRDALLGSENAARYVLDAVSLHEQGDWDGATQAAARVGLEPHALPVAYRQALAWARQVTSAAAA
jgi:c-di-GMP-related signal transduction protein